MAVADIGLIGLGTMGAMLSLNIADNGFTVAVHNRTAERIPEFFEMAGELRDQFTGHVELKDFVEAIAKPRNIILMVPAGDPVDRQIEALLPYLDEDDLIIDAGNANFHDTERRAAAAENAPYRFLGIGVSGGAEGARFGPSIMGGGDKGAWDRVSNILEAVSAKHNGTPCATHMGSGGAGHFVKTVHNGIEYADMQLIAEAYGLMRDGMKMDAGACADIFAKWDEGALKSYLIEISAKVASAKDPATAKPVLDVILDRAGQKGTGRWTVIESQMLGAPIPVIEAAVVARNLSAARDLRLSGAAAYGETDKTIAKDALSLDDIEQALIAGKVLCYAQGFELLHKASAEYGWNLPMASIAQVWRQGCIIRSAMLDDMSTALEAEPDKNLALSSHFKAIIADNIAGLRKTAVVAQMSGLAVPALSSALAYFDQMTTARTTANMLQGQRDYFGAHSFERIDQEGAHHGPWLNQHMNQ